MLIYLFLVVAPVVTIASGLYVCVATVRYLFWNTGDDQETTR